MYAHHTQVNKYSQRESHVYPNNIMYWKGRKERKSDNYIYKCKLKKYELLCVEIGSDLTSVSKLKIDNLFDTLSLTLAVVTYTIRICLMSIFYLIIKGINTICLIKLINQLHTPAATRLVWITF